MDIYVVLDGARLVGASAKLQGAELIRADEARRLVGAPADEDGVVMLDERTAYDRMRVDNTELQDVE